MSHWNGISFCPTKQKNHHTLFRINSFLFHFFTPKQTPPNSYHTLFYISHFIVYRWLSHFVVYRCTLCSRRVYKSTLTFLLQRHQLQPIRQVLQLTKWISYFSFTSSLNSQSSTPLPSSITTTTIISFFFYLKNSTYASYSSKPNSLRSFHLAWPMIDHANPHNGLASFRPLQPRRSRTMWMCTRTPSSLILVDLDFFCSPSLLMLSLMAVK